MNTEELELLESIDNIDIDVAGSMILEEKPEQKKRNLSNIFLVPPFSILDSRKGHWLNRKRYWLDKGIKSEDGRGKNLLFNERISLGMHGTSIFCPFLCEIMYKWFCVPEGVILDTFCGGSVRGIVAQELGFNYIGLDVRGEQIQANIKNGLEVCGAIKNIKWIHADGRNVNKYVENEEVDFIFLCPPYYGVEIYSDLPADISTSETPEAFLAGLYEICKKTASKLKENRFACVVISDSRDKNGFPVDHTGTVKAAFKEEGLHFYNDIIFINSIGNSFIRAGRNMNNRKTTRIHQNILCFYKGDPKKIKYHFGKMVEDNNILNPLEEVFNDWADLL